MCRVARSLSAGLLPGDAAAWSAAWFCDHADYPLKVTPYFASLIRRCDPHDPIARQCVPSRREAEPGCEQDPLHELRFSPLPGLIHAYPDRVLLLPTSTCAVHCRHCNRRWRRMQDPVRLSPDLLAAWLDYLRGHPEAQDVLVTGGDPLTLADEEIEELLAAVRTARPAALLRLGTRMPAVQPARVTTRLCDRLRRFHPLYLNTQVNCRAECTPELAAALSLLADAGLVLGNQMVLLAGVNDDAEEIAGVNRWLVRNRCRPYYLFLPEQVAGTMHFQVPLPRAIEIAESLRARLSGLAMPHVVVDMPDARGKVPVTRGIAPR